MAERSAGTTAVEGDEVGPSDRMLPKALELMGVSGTKLYEVGRELKKSPILREAVDAVAFELSEAADDFGPRALEFGAGRDEHERLAREEIAELAKRHVVRLHDCELRKRLMNFRHEMEFDGPIQNRDEDSEGFTERGRLRSLLAEVKWTLAGLGAEHPGRGACEEFAEALGETLAFYEDGPASVADPDAADPEQTRPTPTTDHQVLRDLGARVRQSVSELSETSDYRPVLSHLADRLQGGEPVEEEPSAGSSGALPKAAAGVAHLAEGLSRHEVILVCTLALTRDEIEEDWDRLDAAGEKGDQKADVKSKEDISSATIDHQHCALSLIAGGKVDPIAAAKAAMHGSDGGTR